MSFFLQNWGLDLITYSNLSHHHYTGTTFSCIGAYHAVTGQVDIIPNHKGHLCIPSVVAFRYINMHEGVVLRSLVCMRGWC